MDISQNFKITFKILFVLMIRHDNEPTDFKILKLVFQIFKSMFSAHGFKEGSPKFAKHIKLIMMQGVYTFSNC